MIDILETLAMSGAIALTFGVVIKFLSKILTLD